ncbi:MAG: helix-turn-helix transcriptional regulator [Anaerolineae bacterium]|nr:helix-turn-helix transcriptional regulator [Anaerolineae bacterium]
MTTYGQYCPVAQALEIIGDRWTLLIIRDMLTGTAHFNDLARGLPGISNALLSKRLQQLEKAGVVEKRIRSSSRKSTEYRLTPAGLDLQNVINALLWWGATWAFGEPSAQQLDPLLLMWWMRNRVRADQLPEKRVAIQIQFQGAKPATYWLVLTRDDVTICLTDPGYEIDLLITADASNLFKLWLGYISYTEAVRRADICIEGKSHFIRAFPNWFAWSPAAPVVQAVREKVVSNS